MYKNAKPLFFICETPLHAGSGSDLGIVDLPIQRERHTSFPKIESSSLKGAIREAVEDVFIDKAQDATDKKIAKERKNYIVNALFGPEETGSDGHAGALSFTDARLLLFPLKSMKGVFAWITCPKVLDQFKRDMKLVYENFEINGDYKSKVSEGKCLLLNVNESKLKIGNSIVLEEYAFTFQSVDLKIDNNKLLQDWFSENLPNDWQEKIKQDIVILSNDDFRDFVNLSTEVITRIGIDNEKGTVKSGALFTEEFLPAETVMYSLVMGSSIFQSEVKKKNLLEEMVGKDESEKIMKKFEEIMPNVIQIGGGATLGKGIVRTKIV